MHDFENEMPIKLNVPISDDQIIGLSIGDKVLILTGRDSVHKWLAETLLKGISLTNERDCMIYQAIKPLLEGGIIYHCGPVVRELENKQYKFIAAGPTTSLREEVYQGDILRHFNIKGIIGKGGMGINTLNACKEVPSVYFHAVGGAASLIAKSVKKVIGVYKLEFGVPEAIWIVQVMDFPVIVTMDAHGHSLHSNVRQHSKLVLEKLIS
jgi:fumarate hydratase subunit beta